MAVNFEEFPVFSSLCSQKRREVLNCSEEILVLEGVGEDALVQVFSLAEELTVLEIRTV